MQYTRREMLDMVLDFVGENDDANARNTAEGLLNIAIWNIWTKMAWQQFAMPSPYTFSMVSGTSSYPLPSYFGRVRNGIIRNTTTGARILPSNLDAIQERDPDLSETGTPGCYAIGGTVGVDVQVVAAGEACTSVSDSASDTTVKVGIAGLDSNSRYRRNQYTLNGTTPVSVGTWKKIIEVAKAMPAGTDPTTEMTSSVGTVTVTGATSGVLVTLATYQSAVERIELTLWPTPNVTNAVAVPCMRMPQKLLYDADLTPLGWGSAILEEMDILWKINTGDMHARPLVAGAALQDLIALENSNRFGVPSRTRPFLG